MTEYDETSFKNRMQGAIESLSRSFTSLNIGRATPGLVENIAVMAYGANMPVSQLASVSVPEARLLSIQVWDMTLVQAVEKSILASGLGLNPQTEGQVIRLRIPEMSEERRIELTKVAGKFAEQAKIAVRNVRRDGMEQLNVKKKNSEISEDIQRRDSDSLQNTTDGFITLIDSLLQTKLSDIKAI